MTTLGGANLRSSTYQVSNGERLSQQSSITPHGAVPEENDTRINVEESSTQVLDGSADGPDPIFYDVSEERRDEYLTYCVPLYHAAIKGDWKTAKLVIDERRDVVRFGISRKLDTALHIAAAAKRATFVEQLVKHMDTSDLALKNRDGNTAMHYAAASGIVKTAKVMYEMNKELPLIRGCQEWTPLYVAALFGQREMMSYLYMRTDFESLSHLKRIELLNVIISAEYYDVALDILGKDSSLAVAREPYTDKTALHVLARKPSAMGTGSELGIWKRSVNSCFKVIYHKDLMQTLANRLVENLWKEVVKRPENEIACLLATPSRLLSDAAALGNVEFLVVLFRSYPDLFWKVDNRNRSLFHIAVENRQESVFNLIYEIGAIKDLIAAYKDDETNNNMLHLAGKLAPRNRLQIVSGAALQLQRELLWFEAVEKIVPPSYLKLKNINEQTPRDLFLESHKELLEKGEKWMIDTATSSMLVATLIATVVFAAAFTVPGGNNNDTGIPVFEREKWFTIFVLSDAVALFSSTVSILMFLSILTARYTEEDFLWSLPSRLVFGLSALFISIAAMLLAFSTVFFLVHDHRLKWIPTLIISLGCFLVILFAFLHYSLWLDIIRSTFRSRFLFRPHKLRLY